MRVVFFIIFILAQVPLLAVSDYVVVVSKNSTVEALDSDMVRDVFLKKRNFDGHTRLLPINLIGEKPVRQEFESSVLKMNREAIKRYWVVNHFQGVSPPPTQASLQSVKSFVEKVKGAIGYLPREMVDDSLRIIYEF